MGRPPCTSKPLHSPWGTFLPVPGRLLGAIGVPVGVSWPASHPSPHCRDPVGPFAARPISPASARWDVIASSLAAPEDRAWPVLAPVPRPLRAWGRQKHGGGHREPARRPRARRVRDTAEASLGPGPGQPGRGPPGTRPGLTHAPPPHRDHAGPLRLYTAADPHHRAHPGWLPVPQLWRPCLRPLAVCHQLPCPPGPVEATDTPEGEQSQVTLAPEHRPAINPLGTSSGLISAGLPASRLGGGLGLREWSLECRRASWRRGL